jgi:hypothetical protein
MSETRHAVAGLALDEGSELRVVWGSNARHCIAAKGCLFDPEVRRKKNTLVRA